MVGDNPCADDTTNRPLFTAAQPSNVPGAVTEQSITGQVLDLTLLLIHTCQQITLIDESAFIVAPDSFRYYESPTTTLQVQALANGQLQVANVRLLRNRTNLWWRSSSL